MKWLFLPILGLLSVSKANAQSINLNDLINLVSASNAQAKIYLTNQKHFIALPIIDTEGATIVQFSKNDIKGITELIVKTAWQDNKRAIHPILSYDVRPKSYADIIVGQLKLSAFRLISCHHDEGKNELLYDDGKFTISIYTFTQRKLPASIEIHIKK
jgi:hypothetical protein